MTHTVKLDLLTLKPADTPDYMTQAWVGCLRWAIGEPEIVSAFRVATGHQWTPAGNPIDAMVDAATGADAEFLRAFILWANVEIWGPMDGDSSRPESRTTAARGERRGK